MQDGSCVIESRKVFSMHINLQNLSTQMGTQTEEEQLELPFD